MKRIQSFVRRSLWALLVTALVGAGCSEDPTDPSPSTDEKTDHASIDRWMFAYMKTHYLWNEAVKEVTPDYSLDYEDFLDDVLLKVAAQTDDKGRPVNYDDGHWTVDATTGQWRGSFYSNIRRYKKSSKTALGGGIQTRGTHEQVTGLGIEVAFYMSRNGDSKAPYVFLIAAVTPGSPADRAGLQRGDLISRVDGSAITDDTTLNTGWTKLMSTESGTVRLTRYDMGTGKEEPEISVTAASYTDNPIWKSKTVSTANGKKVGYLCYGSFNYYYDDELIDAFKQFRDERIDELVLDLRYNGGGHVVSSVVLGTLVAGDAHKGEVYARTTYNESRQKETADIYRLGEAEYNAASPGYYRHDPIATALLSAVGLSRIYVLCTDYTASASELLINGLRGVDIDVRLIGSTTDGKNVGMEMTSKTFGDYEYEFSPITFYIANGKGESDYGNGFAPDVEADEYFLYKDSEGKIAQIDWGDEEHETLFRLALQWIETGSQPMLDSQRAVATRGFQPLQIRSLAPVRVQDMLRLPATEE